MKESDAAGQRMLFFSQESLFPASILRTRFEISHCMDRQQLMLVREAHSMPGRSLETLTLEWAPAIEPGWEQASIWLHKQFRDLRVSRTNEQLDHDPF